MVGLINSMLHQLSKRIFSRVIRAHLMKRIKRDSVKRRMAFVWAIQYQIQREAFTIWKLLIHHPLLRDDKTSSDICCLFYH